MSPRLSRRDVLTGAVASSLLLALPPSGQAAVLPGKVIHYGWRTPLVPALYANTARCEAIPFDGLVIDPDKINGNNSAGTRMGWQLWRTQELDLSRWEPQIRMLETTPFARYTDNFLPCYVASASYAIGYQRWWNDAEWAIVLRNITKAGQVLKRCGLKGLFFDVEWYQAPVWWYPQQADAAEHSYLEYGAKVRQRGREFMQALRSGYAHAVVLASYGYSLAWRPPIAGGTLETSKNGLLPFFLDGMLEAIQAPQLLYDGFEHAYGYRTESQFRAGYTQQLAQCPPYHAPDVLVKYQQHYRAGMGLWVDYRSHSTYPWDPVNVANNYFTPEQFETSLRLALRYSDKYAWIYSQQPNWWDESMPHGYIDALAQARMREGV